jgi:DNA-binding transcriptional ArsR family regulator
MKGNLRDFSGTQILNLVNLAKRTGTLGVDSKGTRATLSFQEGRLVHAALKDADGSLASVLVRDGRINKQQAAALAQRATQTGDKQLGLLLIQKGYLSRADIIQSIKKHLLSVVRQFASWREGMFVFDSTRLPSNDHITVPLDLENVIIEIARVQKRDENLEEEIPSLDVPLRFVERPTVRLQDLKLSRDEWRVLNYIRPENTIRMIATRLKMSDAQVRRVVGSLREAGLIELVRVRPPQQMSSDQKKEKRAIVQRLITHFQGMGPEEQRVGASPQ